MQIPVIIDKSIFILIGAFIGYFLNMKLSKHTLEQDLRKMAREASLDLLVKLSLVWHDVRDELDDPELTDPFQRSDAVIKALYKGRQEIHRSAFVFELATGSLPLEDQLHSWLNTARALVNKYNGAIASIERIEHTIRPRNTEEELNMRFMQEQEAEDFGKEFDDAINEARTNGFISHEWIRCGSTTKWLRRGPV